MSDFLYVSSASKKLGTRGVAADGPLAAWTSGYVVTWTVMSESLPEHSACSLVSVSHENSSITPYIKSAAAAHGSQLWELQNQPIHSFKSPLWDRLAAVKYCTTEQLDLAHKTNEAKVIKDLLSVQALPLRF